MHKIKLVHISAVPVTPWLFLRGQNSFMTGKGLDVHVVASPDPLLDKLAKRDSVHVHPVKILRKCSPIRDLVSLVRLVALLLRLRPEIVQLSTPKAAMIASIASWMARVPVRIFLVRGLVSYKLTGFEGFRVWLHELLTARLCHQTICESRSLLEFARDTGIISELQGTVLANGMGNGVDTERFDPRRGDLGETAASLANELQIPRDCFVIGVVGRFAMTKGFEDLVTAWRIIREECATSRLLLVGNWDERDIVPDRIKKALTEDPRVVFSGCFVDDPAPYYLLMSLLIQPSTRGEGFPNVPMEAAAMELPVVTTNVIGCTDTVIEGVTGTVVPPHDPMALASAIRVYLRDAGLRRKHGQAGRERAVRDFQPVQIWSELYNLYVRLLGTRGIALTEPE